MRSWFALLVRRRFLVLMIALAAAAAGVANLEGLSIDAVPDISPKQVMILTLSPGLGALEVERLVTFPVENAMAGAPSLTGIRFDVAGRGLGGLRHLRGRGCRSPRRAVRCSSACRRQGHDAAGRRRPADGPVGDRSRRDLPVRAARTRLHADAAPPHPAMDDRAEAEAHPRHRRRVNIYGGQMPTYEVRVSADALRRYGVGLAHVFTALTDNNAARGGRLYRAQRPAGDDPRPRPRQGARRTSPISWSPTGRAACRSPRDAGPSGRGAEVGSGP